MLGANKRRPSFAAFFVVPVFFGLAAWLFFGPDFVKIPTAATPKINPSRLVPGPLREVILTTNPPKIHINGFDRSCMDCHRTFFNVDPRVTKLEQHKHVKLHHGINTHCYNCHDAKDRNLLVRRDGTKIPFTAVPELCSQCHVRIYGDWQQGLHGKRLGYWAQTMGPQKAIVCTGCHDPHWPSRPAMLGMRPLPAPNTLRMGHEGEEGKDLQHAERDPLQRATRNEKRRH